MMVPTFITLISELHHMGCLVPTCCSKYLSFLLHRLFSSLFKHVFLVVVGGLGPPSFAWLGCTANCRKKSLNEIDFFAEIFALKTLLSRLWKIEIKFSISLKGLLKKINFSKRKIRLLKKIEFSNRQLSKRKIEIKFSRSLKSLLNCGTEKTSESTQLVPFTRKKLPNFFSDSWVSAE